MINGNLEQFLDTGWYSEATLILDGSIYWCETQSDCDSNIICFFVDKWAAENENNLYYHSILESDGTLKWERVLQIKDNDMDIIKRKFLESPVFDGKTFWQVSNKIAWLDEGEPIVKDK